MNRRQLLQRLALAGTTAGFATAVASADETPDGTPATAADRPRAVVRADEPVRTSGSATGTATGTPTPTPTEAVATPTSAWEPTGQVAVPGASETVLAPDGETAFVATGDGFAVIDISNPSNPAVRTRETDISPDGTDRVMADVFDVKYDDGHLLVAGPAGYHPDAFRGVVRYDVGDPASPRQLSAHETTFPVHNCDLAGEYAYLTGNDGEANPLVVVELGGEPREVARWSVLDRGGRWPEVAQGLRTLHDVYVQDDVAFLAYWDAGTWILDVADPADPTPVADVRQHSLDDLAGYSGLRKSREYLEPPGNDHYVATDPAGDLLAIGRESWNSNVGLDATTPGPDDPGGPSGVALYDVSDRASPTHLATIDPPPTADPNYNGVSTTAHNFELSDRYLYSSWYQGGVKVHDVSDPANPTEVRHFRRSSTTSFWTAQLAVPGETVVATSYRNPADLDDSGTVYAFPDVPRETRTDRATRTQERSPTRATTASETPSEPPSDPPTATTPPNAGSPSSPGEPATTGDGSGFGPLAALVAAGLGAWRLVGEIDREESDG